MWINILVVLVLFNLSGYVRSVTYPTPSCYKKEARIGSCTDKYAAIPNHLNCRFPPSGRPFNVSDEDTIIHIHNNLRSSVSPPAADMLELGYNSGLQRMAARWVRLCTVESTWFERSTPGAFLSGQNIFMSPTNVSWTEVLDVWKAEGKAFHYKGTGNKISMVGNYTQMIWASTAGVGCAVSHCSHQGFYLYMCLYAPMMDPAQVDTPYKESMSGSSCDDCNTRCNKTTHMCDCFGVTCLGGSTLNLTTCMCDCINSMKAPHMYNGTICDLTCSDPNGDDPTCGSPPFTNDSCDTNMKTMFHCPYMCYVCPYAGVNYHIGTELLPWEKGLPKCTTTTTTTTTTTAPPATTTNTITTPKPSGTTVKGHSPYERNGVRNVSWDAVFTLIFTFVTCTLTLTKY